MRLKGWLWLLVVLLTIQVAAQETGKVELERHLAILEGPVNDPRQWVLSAYNVGNFYRNNEQQAERYYLKGIAVAQKHDLLDLEASIYNQLSIVFRNEQKGLKYLEKTIQCVEKLDDKSRLMNLRIMQAAFYFRLQDPRKSIALYEELLPEFRKTASRSDLVLALFNYGNAVLALGDYEKAIELGEVVSSISVKIQNSNMELRGLLLQAKALGELGQKEAAFRIYNEALNKAESSFNTEIQSTALSDISNLLIGIGDLNRARPYLIKAAELSKTSSQPEKQFFVLNQLSRLYIAMGELENAKLSVTQMQEVLTGRKIAGEALLQLVKGRLLFESGEKGRGVDLMQRGLLRKGRPNIHVSSDRLLVAEYFSEKSFYKKAEEHFDILKSEIKQLPANFQETYALAWLKHQQRKRGNHLPLSSMNCLFHR